VNDSSEQEILELDVKRLIVDALMLEDVTPEQIETDATLFVEGLGLDSIDALELAIAVERRYKVKIAADDAKNREIFRSVRTLAQHIGANRPAAEALP
jgi:acyl carrier protein